MREGLPEAVGPYRVLDRIGGGGMAEVFLVESPGLRGSFRRRMALKRVLPELAGDSAYTEQFLDEARLLGGMNHPNIVTASDAGEHEGSFYLVMELVEGTDLGRLLRARRLRGPLPQSLAVYVASGIASALAYAHLPPREAVHRDVSPQNILLSHHGQVLLADFGIARYAARDHRTATTSMVKGKIEYMSPEQIETPQTIDRRSDLFSLGIVLYQMLAGRHPFLYDLERGEEQQVLSRMMRAASPSPIIGVEPELDELVRALLARERDDRPATASEVLDVLCDMPQRSAPGKLLGQFVREAMPPLFSQIVPPDLVEVDPLSPSMSSERELEITDNPVANLSGGFELIDDDTQTVVTTNSSILRKEPSSRSSRPPPLPARGTGPSASTKESQSRSSAKKGEVPIEGQAPVVTPIRPAGRHRWWWWGRGAMFGTPPVLGLLLAAFIMANPRPARTKERDSSLPVSKAVLPPATPPQALLQGTALSGSSQSPTGSTGAAARLAGPSTPAAASAEKPSATPQAPTSSPTSAPDTPETSNAPGNSSDASSSTDSPSKPSETVPVEEKPAQIFVAVIPWGRVWLDGQLRGEAPLALDNLRPGRYLIQVGQTGPTESHKVRLKAGPNRFEYYLK